MIQSTFDLNGKDQTPVIACGELPQQRFETYGAEALSDTELIAILLHSGIRGHTVLGLASNLIAQAGSIAGLASWQPEDFQRLKGIGRAKALQLAALVEIGRRLMRSPTAEAPMLNRPELVASCHANWRSSRPPPWPPITSFRRRLRRMPVVMHIFDSPHIPTGRGIRSSDGLRLNEDVT
jgi:hypothetical protein